MFLIWVREGVVFSVCLSHHRGWGRGTPVLSQVLPCGGGGRYTGQPGQDYPPSLPTTPLPKPARTDYPSPPSLPTSPLPKPAKTGMPLPSLPTPSYHYPPILSLPPPPGKDRLRRGCRRSFLSFLNPITFQGSQVEWRSVFFLTAGVYLFGGLAYLIFGGGDVEDWAKATTDKETVSDSKNKTSDFIPMFSLSRGEMSGTTTISSEDIIQSNM